MASNSTQSSSKDKASTTRPSLSGTVAKIRQNNPANPKKVQEALVFIRKYFIKEKTGIDRLRHYGGIEVLFDVIQGTHQMSIDIALSILGNISMDTKVQFKVLNIDGIKVLGTIISTVDSPDVVNRACRALGNLAQNRAICIAIHNEDDLIADVVTHLTKTDNVNLQLTLIRTLRLFADTTAHKQGVLLEEGLRAVSLHLKSGEERVIKAAYHCMLVLSKDFSDICARQIVAADAPAAVLAHTEHISPEIKKAAFNVILNTWMTHHEMRVGIGNAGGVPFFIKHINTLTDCRKRLIMANSLCLSCCEVVNQVRVKDNGGLQMFLTMLQEEAYTLLHDRLISTLTCFLYDESGWEILMKNGLVKVLIKHLKRVANLDELVKKHQGVIVEKEVDKDVKQQHEEMCKKDKVQEVIIGINNEVEEKPKQIVGKSTEEAGGSRSEINKVAQEQQSAKGNTVPSQSVKDDSLSMKTCKQATIEISKQQEEKEFTMPIVNQYTTEAEVKNPIEMEVKPNVTRYSVDSPTYKSVVDWSPDDYMSGPKNILESEHYQCCSPDRLSGYSSPANYRLYSPLSVSSFDVSPDTSPRPRSVSPYQSSPEKTFVSSPENLSHGSSNSLGSSTPIWSPIRSSFDENETSQFSLPDSPNFISGLSTPLMFAGVSNDLFLDEPFQYSSSDDDTDTKDLIELSDTEEDLFVNERHNDMEVLEGEVAPSTSFALESGDKTNPSDGDSKTSNSNVLNFNTPTDDFISTSVKWPQLLSKSGTKRKRDSTPEKRKRILLSVEQSQSVPSPSIDLKKMMSGSIVFNMKKELGLQKELPTDRKDHRRQTEYCLIMLFKKISCYPDPTENLINPLVLGTLLDYVSLAERTFAKCGRILIRLTKNAVCFEAIILNMIPNLINDRLLIKSTIEREKKDCQSKAKKSTKPPESFNRSLSACTLNETVKAEKFHHEAKRQRKITFRKNKGVTQSETAELKCTLFSNLAFMAETPFGQGVIEHLLLTAESNNRIRTAISLALICRSRSLQTKMYIEHHGFRYLIMALEQKDDAAMQSRALCGLCMMASLSINKQFSLPTSSKLPKTTGPTMNIISGDDSCTSPAPSPLQPKEDLFDIVFKMEDGSEVSACRTTLAEHSEVFKAMLKGHYSESGKSEINMPGVSNAAFQIVVDYLHDKLLGSQYDLDVVLEAHGLADRFILDNLTRNLCDIMVDSCHLTIYALQRIFAHAVLHEAYWVMKKCMNLLLLDQTVDEQQRLATVLTVFSSPQGDVAVDVIEDMFRS